MKRILKRRDFMKNASCAALGTTTLWNTMLNLKTMKAAANFNSCVASGGQYKALVCLLLEGGMDSFNMLMPTTASEYDVYANTRSNLATPNFDCNDPNNPNNIRPLGNDPCNSTHGVHPMMENMQSLYNEGKLAFISNVGTMVEQVTKANIWNSNLPLGLFSHIDQVAHWQTGVPHERLATGWGGKMADLLIDANQQQDISMNMSFAGSNSFQTGINSVAYALEGRLGDFEGGSRGFQEFEWDPDFDAVRSTAVNSIIDKTYHDIFQKTYINTLKTARDGHTVYSEAFANAPGFSTQFGMDELSGQFEVIAKTIQIQSTLQMNRQIFFVRIGGWDHHEGLGDDYNDLVATIDNALGSFQQAMEEINMSDCVTTFSISEFGRTLTSNGNGSDHAWGGNMFVMGGAVNGANIYGDYPILELDSDIEIGGGVLIPTLSADQYFAEIAKWFGVMNSDLSYLFPNIGAFYDVNSNSNPIGFLNL